MGSTYSNTEANMSRTSFLADPPPNPPFVFPMQSEPSPRDDSSGGPTLQSTSSAKRSSNRTRPRHLSIDALPDFEFHPSPSSNENRDAPKSPTKAQRISPHPTGHRRNGSEFIGGNGKNASTGLMSTSPTKGEGTLPPPPGARSGPPSGRRGHAHRRSGAISSHDVTVILKPASETRGGSAPTTPSDPLLQPDFAPAFDRSVSQPAISQSQDSSPRHHRPRSSSGGPSRPRVGFSDQIEFIPRPLSTISSDTSSSLSTVRAGHSVTGSISSIMSSGNISPPSARAPRTTAMESPSGETTVDMQHSTANALASDLQNTPNCGIDMRSLKRGPQGSTIHVSPSRATISAPVPSWSDLFSAPRTGPESHVLLNDDSSSASLADLPDFAFPDVARSRRRPVNANNSPVVRPRTSPEPKVSKRQKKVKYWAGSLLAKKARHPEIEGALIDEDSSKAVPPTFAPLSGFSLDDINFDEDTSCVIQTIPPQRPTAPKVQTDLSSQKPWDASPTSDSDSPGPVLDLDAALGSSTTPNLSPAFEDVIGNRLPALRRRLHSSGTTGAFDGPGMHYHRRTESAPEMAPFNHHAFGFTRFGSNPTMDDVFEEDEDGSDEPNRKERKSTSEEAQISDTGQEGQLNGLGVKIVDSENATGSPVKRNARPCALDSPRYVDKSTSFQPYSIVPIPPASVPNQNESVEIVGPDEEPRASAVPKACDDSTTTPTLPSDVFVARPVSAPIDFAAAASSPAFTGSEAYSSVVSSPDFSQTSFDAPHIHTATSSITDRLTLGSSRAGEQGLEIRASVDDVPSLTSGASTMISGYSSRYSSSMPTRTSADQVSLASAAVPSRNRSDNASKRSSLASLSRFVGGSYAGRSKLNIAECVQPDEAEKPEKKKGNRVSRLVRFWKSKGNS